jgi:hypothetical protein
MYYRSGRQHTASLPALPALPALRIQCSSFVTSCREVTRQHRQQCSPESIRANRFFKRVTIARILACDARIFVLLRRANNSGSGLLWLLAFRFGETKMGADGKRLKRKAERAPASTRSLNPGTEGIIGRK